MMRRPALAALDLLQGWPSAYQRSCEMTQAVTRIYCLRPRGCANQNRIDVSIVTLYRIPFLSTGHLHLRWAQCP